MADLPGRQRIRSDAARRRVDRLAGRERHVERRRLLGLDGNDPDPTLIPGGDAADQATAADSDQQRIDIGQVFLDLPAERALADKRLGLVEGMDLQRACPFGEDFAGGQRIGIAVAADDEVGAETPDAVGLGLG